jgi:hypothetical protein
MKITSINFIKEGEVPKQTKNTELSAVVAQIAEAVRKAPAGSAVTLKLDETKRWTAYALKRALLDKQKLACQLISRDGTIYVMRAPEPKPKK